MMRDEVTALHARTVCPAATSSSPTNIFACEISQTCRNVLPRSITCPWIKLDRERLPTTGESRRAMEWMTMVMASWAWIDVTSISPTLWASELQIILYITNVYLHCKRIANWPMKNFNYYICTQDQQNNTVEQTDQMTYIKLYAISVILLLILTKLLGKIDR